MNINLHHKFAWISLNLCFLCSFTKGFSLENKFDSDTYFALVSIHSLIKGFWQTFSVFVKSLCTFWKQYHAYFWLDPLTSAPRFSFKSSWQHTWFLFFLVPHFILITDLRIRLVARTTANIRNPQFHLNFVCLYLYITISLLMSYIVPYHLSFSSQSNLLINGDLGSNLVLPPLLRSSENCHCFLSLGLCCW